jgi:uncharacterized protein (TIGR03437 family)
MGRSLAFSLLAFRLSAQLIPPGMPVPITSKPPVVFVNGYQSNCTANQFSDNFGKFDQLFQATGRVSLFFDNCTLNGKPPIEEVGNALRDFLQKLRYTDSSPVSQVDIVAHSMGGLVVRSYLSGKQTAAGVFQPPPDPGIRKAIFLATPHWGSPIANIFGSSIDAQVTELQSGTAFTFDLGTWNQGHDDLRGIDALALAGNGGTGRAIAAGFDDGVVSLTSASIEFAEPGRTRIVPYCHTTNQLVIIAGFCSPDTPAIALGNNATDPNAAAVLSFLNDTTDWMNVGEPAEQNPLLKMGGGLQLRAESTDEQILKISKATTTAKDLNISSDSIAWTELITSQPQAIMLTTPLGTLQTTLTPAAARVTAATVKNGPLIAAVFPTASAVFPLAVAPGTFIAIYGSNLAASPLQAGPPPFPNSLGGVEVTVNGTAIPLQYVSAGQVNAVMPDSVEGLVKLALVNGSGSHTVNLWIEPSVPAIYTQDQTGKGPASALNGITNQLITAANPLRTGDYVSLYLTGLGSAQPSVTVGGTTSNVTYAGEAPGYPGLNQINCQLALDTPAGSAIPVIVTALGRRSNVVTVAVQ